MKNKVEHSPTPWNYNDGDKGVIGYGFMSYDGHGKPDYTNPSGSIVTVHGVGAERDADAAFIVKAVNSHEELLNVLKSCAGVLDNILNSNVPPDDDIDMVLTEANAVIKKLAGE